MSQLALALAASIERAHVGRIERGEAIPNLVAMIKLAQALECTLTDLVSAFESSVKAAGRRRRAHVDKAVSES